MSHGFEVFFIKFLYNFLKNLKSNLQFSLAISFKLSNKGIFGYLLAAEELCILTKLHEFT
jgi:hypothetical protein